MSGEVFGPYRLESLLGRGGMGEVWRALDTRKDRPVALKLLGTWLGGDEDFARRFRRESALAARLNAPNILAIHDYGDIEGRLFLDMPLIEGIDLGGLLQRGGPLPPTRAVGIACQVARALGAAHRAGLVHRDVKPSNILVTDTDGDDHVYLIDFGIARAVDGTQISQTGAAIGTPDYMAPERFIGQGDHRADIYALGGVLYQALTGRPPFAGDDLLSLMWAHVNTAPPRPSTARDTVPTGLDDVVACAMAKGPDQRYPSAADLAIAARGAITNTRRTSDPATSPTPPPVADVTMGPPPRPQEPPTGSARSPHTRLGQSDGWAHRGNVIMMGVLSLGAALLFSGAAANIPQLTLPLVLFVLAIVAGALRYRVGRGSGEPIIRPSLIAGFAVASNLVSLVPEIGGPVGATAALCAVASAAAIGLYIAAAVGLRSVDPSGLGRVSAQRRIGDVLAASCLSILLIYLVVVLRIPSDTLWYARPFVATGVTVVLLMFFVVISVLPRAVAGTRRVHAATLVTSANHGLVWGLLFAGFVSDAASGTPVAEAWVSILVGLAVISALFLWPNFLWLASAVLQRRIERHRSPTRPGLLLILSALSICGVVVFVVGLGVAVVQPASPVPGSRSGVTRTVTAATPPGQTTPPLTDPNRVDAGARVLVDCEDQNHYLRLSSGVRNSSGYEVAAGNYILSGWIVGVDLASLPAC